MKDYIKSRNLIGQDSLSESSRPNPLGLDEILYIFNELVKFQVNFMELGYVHSDLKERNVLVIYRSKYSNKVVDPNN